MIASVDSAALIPPLRDPASDRNPSDGAFGSVYEEDAEETGDADRRDIGPGWVSAPQPPVAMAFGAQNAAPSTEGSVTIGNGGPQDGLSAAALVTDPAPVDATAEAAPSADADPTRLQTGETAVAETDPTLLDGPERAPSRKTDAGVAAMAAFAGVVLSAPGESETARDQPLPSLPTAPVVAPQAAAPVPVIAQLTAVKHAQDGDANGEKDPSLSRLDEAQMLSLTPTRAAQPFHAVAASAPGVAPQIAAAIIAAITVSGPVGDALEVALSPEELGRVRIDFRPEAGGMRVVLTAERGDTLDLMRRHGDQLMADLREAGFDGASLSFGQWGQSQEGSDDRQRPIFALRADPAADRRDALLAHPIPPVRSARPGLDLRI